ncbi:MAG: hypothetical protein H7X92_12570 [Chitinophagales bacterium]|nr:hypothetical protein [Hyphomicrobiales bacterium]
MAVDTFKAYGATSTRLRKKEALEYRLIFGAAVLIFIPVAIVARMLPGSLLGSMHQRSVFSDAKAAANRCVPFVFMS